GEDRLEVSGIVGRVLASDDLAACNLDRLGDLVGQNLAVVRPVVEHRDFLYAQVIYYELTVSRPLLGVASHHAEGRVVALLRVFRRGGHGDLRQARIVVDPRGRDGGARVEVAQDALDALVDDLLGDLHGGARVGLVIAGDEF